VFALCGAAEARLQRRNATPVETVAFTPSLRAWADSAEMGPCLSHDPQFPYGAVQIGSIVAQACHRRAAAGVKSVLENPVSAHIAHVTDDQFEDQVLKSSDPVLVDFWAEWCGPCKMIAPILDDLAAAYQGKLKVAKINIDHNQKTPRNYNVRGIPTLMIFKDGKVQATQIGAVSKTQLTQIIDKAIGGSSQSSAA
jgi:thioredoxin 1